MDEIDYADLPDRFKGADPEPDVDAARMISWGDSWTASWETEASDQSLINMFDEKLPDVGPLALEAYNSGEYNSYQDLGERYPELAHESLFQYFDDLKSPSQLDYMAKRIGRQVDARRTQQNAPGVQQFLTDTAAGTVGSASLAAEVALLASPLAKGGRALYQGAKTGTKALIGAATVGVGTGVDAFIRYQDQELMTKEQAYFETAAGVAFGGALGGLAGVLRPKTISVNPDMSRTMPESGGAIGAYGESGGAAERLIDISLTEKEAIMKDKTLTDDQKFMKIAEKQAEAYAVEEGFLGIGKGAIKAGAFVRVNPETTLAVSKSPTMRRFGAFMTNAAYLRKGQAEGEGFVNIDAIGRRADTRIEQGVAKIYESNYAAYKKSVPRGPDRMTQIDFDNQVRVAGSRGDAHLDPHVQKTAQELRKEFTGPMSARGVRHKILKGDENGNVVSPLGDKTHVIRSYSRAHAGRVTPNQFADGLIPGYMKRLRKDAISEKQEIDAKITKLREDAKAKGEKVDPVLTKKIRGDNPHSRELKRLEKDDKPLRERFIKMRNNVMNGSEETDGHEFNSVKIDPKDGSLMMSQRRTLDMATEDIPKEYFDPDPKMSMINALKKMERQLLVYEDPRFNEDPTFRHWTDLRRREHDANLAEAGDDVKKTKKLLKELDTDLTYINGLVKQYYGIRPDNPSAYASTTLANLKAFTALTGLGSVLFSTFAELGAGLAHYGVQGYIRTISSAVLSPKALKEMSKVQKATLDIGIQGAQGMRIMEVGEYAGDMGKYSRMLHWTADKAVDRVYMLGTWTRAASTGMAMMAQSEMARRVMKKSLSKRDLSDLGRFGVDKEMLPLIRKEIETHGNKLPGGMWNPAIEKWGNQGVKRDVTNAVNQEVDNIIIRPGVGSTPLVGKTLLGSTALQFKQFLLAATSKYGIADVQRVSMGDFRGLERQMALAGLGYISIGLKNQYLYGEDAVKRWDGMSEKERIIEGVIQGGGGGLAYDVANLMRESAYPGSSSRYYGQRSVTSMALGPNFGKVEDLYNIAGIVGAATSDDQEFTKAHLKTVMRNIPGMSFWPVRVGWPTMKDDIYEAIK